MSEEKSSGMNPAVKVILIVAAILGVLGCGVAAVLGWMVRDNVVEQMKGMNVDLTKTQMRVLEDYINHHRLQHRALPETLADLVGPDAVAGDVPVPTDAWGGEFTYVPGTDGRSYELSSFGADGVPGGEGEDADITRESLRAAR